MQIRGILFALAFSLAIVMSARAADPGVAKPMGAAPALKPMTPVTTIKPISRATPLPASPKPVVTSRPPEAVPVSPRTGFKGIPAGGSTPIGEKPIPMAPNVSKTPDPGGPVPLPYRNVPTGVEGKKPPVVVRKDPLDVTGKLDDQGAGEPKAIGREIGREPGQVEFVQHAGSIKVEGGNVRQLSPACTNNGSPC